MTALDQTSPGTPGLALLALGRDALITALR